MHSKDINYDKMLDLNDPNVRSQLGIEKTQIDSKGLENYELTQAIADAASKKS